MLLSFEKKQLPELGLTSGVQNTEGRSRKKNQLIAVSEWENFGKNPTEQ